MKWNVNDGRRRTDAGAWVYYKLDKFLKRFLRAFFAELQITKTSENCDCIWWLAGLQFFIFPLLLLHFTAKTVLNQNIVKLSAPFK